MVKLKILMNQDIFAKCHCKKCETHSYSSTWRCFFCYVEIYFAHGESANIKKVFELKEVCDTFYRDWSVIIVSICEK